MQQKCRLKAHSSKELVQLSVLKSGLKNARKTSKTAKAPGSFRPFQAIYFDSSEDSDLEGGRGPKRKVVRLEATDDSMPNASEQNSENLEVFMSTIFTLAAF